MYTKKKRKNDILLLYGGLCPGLFPETCGWQILSLAVCASVLARSLAKLSLLAAARRFIFAPER